MHWSSTNAATPAAQLLKPRHAQRRPPIGQLLLAAIIVAFGPARAVASDATPFTLGAQTHFAQGWSLSILGPARGIGVSRLRDSMPWHLVEQKPGRYDFSHSKTSYPAEVLAGGFGLGLVFQFGNPLYDQGFISYSEAGRTAMARFIDAVLSEYPRVATVEIGNEYNSQSFASGPIKEAPMSERDDYYVALLRAVHRRLQRSHPEVRILGGATHSIPVDYLKEVFRLGALDLMDGLAIHPYTTPPEQFADQLRLLVGAMGEDAVPIHVTEFGKEFDDLDDAPAYLLKMVSAMAAAGVAGARWYALREQRWFDNMELLSKEGTPTPAGRAMRFIQERLLRRSDPIDISPNETTYIYRFGDDAVVMWGEPRRVDFRVPVHMYRATGEEVTDLDGMLDPDEPLVAIAAEPLVMGKTLVLSEPRILADSFHHFDVTNRPGTDAGFEGPWSYFELSGVGEAVPLYTMGGGHKAGEPWTPYIGSRWRRPLAVTARAVRPVDFSGGKRPEAKYSVLERFTAARDGDVTLVGHWDVDDATVDGVKIVIRHNGEEIFSSVVFDQDDGHVRDVVLDSISIKAGDTLDIVTSTNQSPAGDRTKRRIQIFRSNATDRRAVVPPG